MVSVTTAPDDGTTEATPDPQTVRDDRLVAVLSRARSRSVVSTSETVLFMLGGALAVAGVVLIIIGWVGTSRTVLVAGQIPYLVSGGLLGLGLVFLGGFLYFGYWLAMLVRENRERAELDRADFARLSTGLEELNRSLSAIAEGLGSGGR